MKKYYFLFLLLIPAWLLPVDTSASISIDQPSQKPVVYLTMDADMSQFMAKKSQAGKVRLWYNPELIQYLKDQKIPVTFFVSGLFAQTYPDLIKSLAANPLFSIQNHSYDESAFTPHCYWLKTLATDQEKVGQIKKTQDILTKLSGKAPVYFRFPGLCHSKADDQLVEKMGFQINEGNIIVGDPFNRKEKIMVANTLRRTEAGGVIIMHIGGRNAPDSLKVLRQIIPALRSEGYTISHL